MGYRIKDVCAINRQVLPEGTPEDHQFKYIDISSVDSNGVITVPEESVRFGAAPSRARRIAAPGSVVVSTVRTYLRAIATVKDAGEPLVFSTGFSVLEPNSNIDGRFLSYYCRSQTFIDEVVSRSVGVSYPAISPMDLACLPVHLPPLEEQRRIADFLDAETSRIDRIVEASRALLHVLADRRSAGVIHAVSGVDSAFGAVGAGAIESSLPWLTSIPKDWAEVRLSLVARMGSGHTPSRARPDWWVDCTIPWVTTGEVQQMRDDRLEVLTVTREKISRVGLANSAAELHPKGTVVLCRTAASAGYSAVMGTDMATSQDLVTWTCGPRLDPFYLLWCLRAMRRDLLGRLAMGSTHKTIYVPDLQALKIPLPPLEKQREIVRRVRLENRRIDGAVDGTRRRIELLSERRQALITAAVTGQFDVSTASGRNTTQGV